MGVLKSIVKPIIKTSNKKNWVILIFYSNDNIPWNNANDKLLERTESIIEINQYGGFVPNRDYVKNISRLIENNYPIAKTEILNRINFGTNTEIIGNVDSALYKILTLYPIRSQISHTTIKKVIARFRGLIFESPSEKTLNFLANICKDECIPIVAYIPNSSYWDRDFMDKCKGKLPRRVCSIYYGNFKKKLRIKSEENDIKFIDGEKVINRNNLNHYAPEGAHLSIKGYELISDLIIKELK